MEKEKILFYSTLTIPRYTSYPTAVEFSTAFDVDNYKNWLGKLDSNNPISIYIHVPYCREICHYCGCNTKAAIRQDVIHAYAELLVKEITLYIDYIKKPLKVSNIHWGGGTPSILGRSGLNYVINKLKEIFIFEDNIEHAIELDPRSVTEDLADGLVEIGVTRVSFGIQDVNPKVQEAIGRVQPLESVEKALELVRERGINAINFDLIYGLPYQTLETLEQTCEVVAKLQPSRIACFGYAHLPQRRANQRLIKQEILPKAFDRFQQATLVEKLLKEKGYVAIGIDHFAHSTDTLAMVANEKKLHRNFQGYTDDENNILLGIGCSSISNLPWGYAQNFVDMHGYERAVNGGEFPVAKGYIFQGEDIIRANIIKSLMCNFEVSLADYAPLENFTNEIEQLTMLIEDGLVEYKDGVITVTESGRPFVRAVAVLFDQFRQQAKEKFSPAI